MGEEDVEARKSRSNDLGNLFEDVEFSRSLGRISLVVGVIKFAFSGLGGESVRSVRKFFLVFSESSLLVNKGGFDFNEFSSVSSKLGFGFFSEVSNGDHEVIKIDLSLDLSFHIIIEESGEIDLELFEETDAFVEGGTIEG